MATTATRWVVLVPAALALGAGCVGEVLGPPFGFDAGAAADGATSLADAASSDAARSTDAGLDAATAFADAAPALPDAGSVGPDASADSGPAAGPDASADSGPLPGPDASAPFDAGEPTAPELRSRAEMCTRWLAEKDYSMSTTWIPGSGGQCDPGTIDPDALAVGMRILNLYRWLSGLAPAQADPSLGPALQQCALMESLNGPPLNHSPPTTWTCYTALGAGTAGSSNLAMGGDGHVPGGSVRLYVNEAGYGLGHRRWCLDTGMHSTYFGAYDNATCLHTIPSTGDMSTPSWVAYPNPGFAPRENFGVWSVQSEVLPLDGGSATVHDDASGAELATLPVSTPMYYAGEAVAFSPDGWQPQLDTTYRVTVTGPSGTPVITYRTTPVQCP